MEIKDEEKSKPDTLIKVSNPFMINGIEAYWKFVMFVRFETREGNGIIELKSQKTNTTLIRNADYYELESFNSINKENFDFNSEFKDANFDGFKDFIVYSRFNSGSGGAFYKVYLFNNVKKSFEYSDELSGGEFEVNKTNKTASNYWKMGIGWNAYQVFHFDKKGKIEVIELTIREIIEKDSQRLLKTTYEKKSKGKTIKTEIDTTIYEGY